jgi:hypothetical protein
MEIQRLAKKCLAEVNVRRAMLIQLKGLDAGGKGQ